MTNIPRTLNGSAVFTDELETARAEFRTLEAAGYTNTQVDDAYFGEVTIFTFTHDTLPERSLYYFITERSPELPWEFRPWQATKRQYDWAVFRTSDEALKFSNRQKGSGGQIVRTLFWNDEDLALEDLQS